MSLDPSMIKVWTKRGVLSRHTLTSSFTLMEMLTIITGEIRLLYKQSLEQVDGASSSSGSTFKGVPTSGPVDVEKVTGEPTLAQVALSIAAYSFCSSMMVVANWFAIRAVKNSAVVTQIQFVFATVTCLILG